MELVDVTDSKSVGGNIVWVRVPPPAPRCRGRHIVRGDFFTKVTSHSFCRDSFPNRTRCAGLRFGSAAARRFFLLQENRGCLIVPSKRNKSEPNADWRWFGFIVFLNCYRITRFPNEVRRRPISNFAGACTLLFAVLPATLNPPSISFEQYIHTYKTGTTCVVPVLWQREKDSNPHKQSQSLSCYPYTIPLSSPATAGAGIIIAKAKKMSIAFSNFSKGIFAGGQDPSPRQNSYQSARTFITHLRHKALPSPAAMPGAWGSLGHKTMKLPWVRRILSVLPRLSQISRSG